HRAAAQGLGDHRRQPDAEPGGLAGLPEQPPGEPGSMSTARLALALAVVGCGGTSAGPDAAPRADATPPPAPRFIGDPTLTPNEVVPLAPQLAFRTDVPTRARVDIDDGTRASSLELAGMTAGHEHPILGLKPARTYRLTLHATSAEGASATAPPLTFTTDPLPENFPPIRVTVRTPERMEPGVTIASVFPRRAEGTGPLRSWL